MRFRWAPLLFSALLFCGGCAHLATPEEKELSYRRFESMKVDGKDLGEYLQQRTAIIVGGAQPVVLGSREHDVDIRLRPVEKDGFDIGSASQLTTDGYFLTAAHCIKRRPLYLLLPIEAGARIARARVVWSPADPLCDIAILKIDVETRPAFGIADEAAITEGADVVTAGANGLAAGKVLSTSSVVQADPVKGTPNVMAIVHTAPLAEGDSGGPLATVEGKLIGIEVLARGLLLGTAQGIALRPEPKWLDETIARDRAAHRATTRDSN